MKPLRHAAGEVLTEDYFMNIKRFLKVKTGMFTLFSIEKHRDLNHIFQGKKYENECKSAVLYKLQNTCMFCIKFIFSPLL
jgi:hypothetical protein